MRATIVADDNMVYVGGEWASVDCSTLPSELHAVQWYDDWGEEEFKSTASDTGVSRQPNNRITDLSPYQSYIDAWQTSYTARKQKEQEEQDAIKQQQDAAAALEAQIDRN